MLLKDHAGDLMPSVIVPDLDMTLARALKVITGYCNKHETCEYGCKLYQEDGCMLLQNYSPCDWEPIIKALAKYEWIPIKWHEITEEEREREGYPKDWVVHIDCDMPCDGDEILVQTKNGYIRWDVCYEDGEFSLDSGWDWIEDIVAWKPLPDPYREDGEA